MPDFTKIQMSSDNSSNKIIKQGTGSFIVPALPGAGETFNFVAIPHNYSSDNLLYQVSTNSLSARQTMLPWAPGNNRYIQYASIDSTNLYVYFISTDTSGLGNPAITVNYTYRILVP